jgi:hypothetical protein
LLIIKAQLNRQENNAFFENTSAICLLHQAPKINLWNKKENVSKIELAAFLVTSI